uniref:Non-structural polyprotein 1AB n=3 Tax=Mamastrovirus 2 TaxID=1239566 RepID=A0A5J6KSU5_9VIRU|nr:ORF1ab [Mamastrovirus 2]
MFYYNDADRSICSGSMRAREEITLASIRTMPGFNPELPLHFEWEVQGLVFPTAGSKYFNRIIIVTGECDGSMRTFATNPDDDSDWREIPTREAPRTLNYIRLWNKCDSTTKRLRIAQQEKATLALDNQLMRHEIARYQQAQQTVNVRTVNMKYILVAAVMIFLALLPSSDAQVYFPVNRTIFTDIREVCRLSTETLNENLNLRIKMALFNVSIYDQYEAIKNILTMQFIPQVHWLRIVLEALRYYQVWNLFSVALTVLTLLKSKKVGTDLTVIVLAHFSGWRMAVLPTIPFQTTLSLWVMNLVMLCFCFDKFCALTMAISAPVLGAVLLSFMDDVNFLGHMRGLLVTTLLAVSCHLAYMLNGSTTTIFIVILAIRTLRLLTSTVGSKLELRDENGKVVATLPSRVRGAAFNFFQRFKQGVRSNINEFTVIKPDALCIIETPEGKGTGFFCGNDIITAGHVVTNHKIVNVSYKGLNYEAKVRYTPTEDVAFITCPGDLHPQARFKLAKNPDYSLVTVTAFVNEDVVVSTANAVVHGETLSYAMKTQDGMSGAPVTDRYGRVVGCHQTNTGYTGGAVIIHQDDFHPHKPQGLEAEVERLKAELELERKKHATMHQSFNPNEIVDLVRLAVEREMQVLRDEINREFCFNQKKKGKTKHGRSGHRTNLRKGARMLTEEEYNELLERGLDRETLLDLIDRIIGERIGYPEYEEDDDYEYERNEEEREVDYNLRIDFDQKRKKQADAKRTPIPAPRFKKMPVPKIEEVKPIKCAQDQAVVADTQEFTTGRAEITVVTSEKPRPQPPKAFSQTYGKAPIWESYDFEWDEDSANDILPPPHKLTKADEIILGSKIQKLRTIISTAIQTQNYSALPLAVFELDTCAFQHGLEKFLQRVKSRKPKNLQGAPEHQGAQEPEDIHSLGAWKTMLQPPVERKCVPNNFPLIGHLKIDRPIYDSKKPRDDLLGLLPEPDWKEFEKFGPTVWGPKAFAKSFDKFFYAEPSNFFEDYPDLCRFADWAWFREFSYLEDTRVIHITATEKNTDSTPAYPKMVYYQTEEDYLDAYGWTPYVREFTKILRGERPDVLWYLFLKKEIIKEEKIRDSDIRQIVCADPIFTRIGASLEAHQNQLMKSKTRTAVGQCGWTPMQGGFKATMQRLVSKGNNYFVEMDWTRYDGTIPTALFRHIKELRWKMINKEQREKYAGVHKWYVDNLLNRYVLLPSGEVTVQTRGNPSGQFSTTMDNNMVNLWLQAFEFAYINGPNKELWKSYDTIVYGDDRLNTTPFVPENYEEMIIEMYRKIFGMWVKPGKVKVQDTIVGLSFCGFTVNENLEPVPTQPEKLMAALLKPYKALPDLESLHGKLLCYQLLSAFMDEDHPFRCYIEHCLSRTAKQLRDSGLPPRFTEEQLHYIWRGGPKDCNG